MKWNSKHTLAVSQIIVVLAFFAGMWMNYFALIPFIDYGEDARITKELDDFCGTFFPSNGCDLNNTMQLDSLTRHNPYNCYDFIIMDGRAKVIYSENKISNVYSYLDSTYGKIASDLLKTVNKFPKTPSRMNYDLMSNTSFYANYETTQDIMFFYAIDYNIVGKEVMMRFFYLLIFMVVGGIIVILISYLISKKIGTQIRIESQVQQDLDTAALIQRSMLPKEEKHLIQMDIDAKLVSAKKVGGDFFSYYLKDGLLYFCIGDVSGKSVPASLFMSRAITLFRSFAYSMTTAKEIAMSLNNELCVGNHLDMFMTGILGIINLSDGQINYVNAGHESPVIWNGKESSKLQYLTSEGNIPFGIMENTEYLEEIYKLEKNGLIVLYTDGITEAKNKNHSLLGREKLLEILENVKSSSSKDINSHLLRMISEYESGIEQSDDITLLTFRYTSNPKKLLIKNRISELSKIASFTEEIFNELSMEHKYRILIRTGLDEALTNCVRYAYNTPDNDIEVTATINKGCLCFAIKDCGIPFNPLEYNPESSDELKVGGLGIFMYRSNFDEVQYDREDGYNILKLIKNI